MISRVGCDRLGSSFTRFQSDVATQRGITTTVRWRHIDQAIGGHQTEIAQAAGNRPDKVLSGGARADRANVIPRAGGGRHRHLDRDRPHHGTGRRIGVRQEYDRQIAAGT